MATQPNPSTSDGRQLQSANRVAVGSTLAVLFCPAPNGKIFGVTIDRKDLDRVLAAGFWRVRNVMGKRGFRLYCTNGCPLVYLHRFLLNAQPDSTVDHIHNRTLDNRRAEIRQTDKSLNALNSIQSRAQYGRGVYKTIHGNYIARIAVDGKQRNLGTYKTPALAGQAVAKFLESMGAISAADSVRNTAFTKFLAEWRQKLASIQEKNHEESRGKVRLQPC